MIHTARESCNAGVWGHNEGVKVMLFRNYSVDNVAVVSYMRRRLLERVM